MREPFCLTQPVLVHASQLMGGCISGWKVAYFWHFARGESELKRIETKGYIIKDSSWDKVGKWLHGEREEKSSKFYGILKCSISKIRRDRQPAGKYPDFGHISLDVPRNPFPNRRIVKFISSQ